MKLETEFKFKHGDILCLTCDPAQSMLLTVHSLIADVCPAGVVQRHYGGRVAWRGKEKGWANKTAVYDGLCKVEGELRKYSEVELALYDPAKDPVAVDPVEELTSKCRQSKDTDKESE